MGYTDRVARKRYLSPFFLVLLGVACGGGDTLPTGPSPVVAAVQFEYVMSGAPTSVAIGCVGQVHLRPSWWGFAEVNLPDIGSEGWAVLFESVPVGRHTLRIDSPLECGTGVISANGTPLTDRVAAKRGVELGFTVHADGSVTP